jgi:hypothetical protein
MEPSARSLLEATPRERQQMRLTVIGTLAAGVLPLSACTEAAPSAAPAATTTTPTWALFEGPSGLEVEAEQGARATLEEQRRAAEDQRRQAEAAAAAARAATEAAAAEEAAAQAAAEATAAEEATVVEEECIGYGCSPEQDAEINDLEVRCSDGTATVEECFGPGADANGNGIADINE